jgi:hypothetical protein
MSGAERGLTRTCAICHTSRMQFDALKTALIGEWRGTKELYMEPPPAAALPSSASLTIAAVAGGSFLQLNYTWSFEGAEQTGVMLFGYEDPGAATLAWVDSFHMSSKIMFCTGSAAADGSVSFLGSYEAPPGPNWGWRTTIRSVSRDELQIVMHNISPEGQEDLAVQLSVTRTD